MILEKYFGILNGDVREAEERMKKVRAETSGDFVLRRVLLL